MKLKLNRDLHKQLENCDAREERVVDRPVFSQKEADSVRNAILLTRSKDLVKASGTCVGLPDLRAGQRVRIAGLGARFSGEYFITDTTHTINDSGYITKFNGRRESRESELDAMKENFGVVTGDCHKPGRSQEAGPDRIEISQASASLESAWAPVAAPLAGKQRGAFFMPESGDEVLVAFEHGEFQSSIHHRFSLERRGHAAGDRLAKSRDHDAGRAHLAVRRRQRKKNRSQVQLRADDHPRRYGKLDHARGRRPDSEDEQRRRADKLRGQTKCRRY